MKGSAQDPGLIPRTLMQIFEPLPEVKAKRSMVAKMTYYEIYNETINDLLNGNNKNLDIREDKDLGIFVKDITQVEVQDYKTAMSYLYI